MTIATVERYGKMLDAAKKGGYAYPAINVTSTQTLNAALQGFEEAQSDGIIQVSVGASAYLSGQTVLDRVTGTRALGEFAHEVLKKHPNITIALHTDHCAEQYLDEWVRPLLALEMEDVKKTGQPMFQSHMWDGSTVPLDKNLRIAKELLALSAKAHTILEIEIGAVGGEEDGQTGAIDDKLYSTPADALKVYHELGLSKDTLEGRYTAAFTFGNVHGAYKPGKVKLRPEILGQIQEAVGKEVGEKKPFDLVFHGGSGSRPEEIAEAVSYGVVKMNVDTDTQYAFTRPIANHMFEDYEGVLKVDGEVGNKKQYDPRSWGKEAEAGMAARVVEACKELGSYGKAIKW